MATSILISVLSTDRVPACWQGLTFLLELALGVLILAILLAIPVVRARAWRVPGSGIPLTETSGRG
jgi:hypothetical protein